MKILALEPFYGGSHQAFIDSWIQLSRHQWQLETLPAVHWKWRMRHAALTFASRLRTVIGQGQRWDAIWCSDMLALADFQSLCPDLAKIPTIYYFHENQLTYPVRFDEPRDRHFAFTNFVSACAADQIWFNSQFHMGEWYGALAGFLRRFPDFQPLEYLPALHAKSQVQPPGVVTSAEPVRLSFDDERPLTIAWAARWEYDKNPEEFFAALMELERRGPPFRLIVLGKQFREVPTVFAEARRTLHERIDHWGEVNDHRDYLRILGQADILVSTAHHEFFGIAAVEAMSLGLVPVLPNRLAYPEVLGVAGDEPGGPDTRLNELAILHRYGLYDGTQSGLVQRLVELIGHGRSNRIWHDLVAAARRRSEWFSWPRRAASMDAAVEQLVVERGSWLPP